MARPFTNMFRRLRDEMREPAEGEPTEDGTIVRLDFTDRETGKVYVVLGYRTEGAWEFTGVPTRVPTLRKFIRMCYRWEFNRAVALVLEEPEIVPETPSRHVGVTNAQEVMHDVVQSHPSHDAATCSLCKLRKQLWGES